MEEKQKYITDKIVSDAKSAANVLIANAKRNFEAELKLVKQTEETQKINTLAEFKTEIGESNINHTNAKSAADRRQRVAMQQELLDKVYDAVKKDLLKDKTFINKMIKKYKEPGDVAEQTEGGVILRNKNYDKVLTVDNLLKSIRESTQGEVARILFEK